MTANRATTKLIAHRVATNQRAEHQLTAVEGYAMMNNVVYQMTNVTHLLTDLQLTEYRVTTRRLTESQLAELRMTTNQLTEPQLAGH